MRKLATLFLAVAVYALVGIGVAAADDDSKKKQQNPDSIVSCFPNGNYRVIASSVPASINSNGCPGFLQSECSPCIRSLENQGCEVVDLVTEFIPPLFSSLPERGVFQSATFQLSCESP